MTLYELLQKVNEENAWNNQNADMLTNLRNKIQKTRQNQEALAKSQLENDKIDTIDYQIFLKKIRRSAEFSEQEIEKFCLPKSNYSEILARLRDCGAYISNKMMCNLLKTQTGANWSFEVIECGSMSAKLIFSNNLGEKFTAQQGMLTQGGNLSFVTKQLENINWFQEFIKAQRVDENELLEMSLVTGQKGFLFPPFIQTTLENFFKHVKVDPNHPENLTLIDNRFVEPKNLGHKAKVSNLGVTKK